MVVDVTTHARDAFGTPEQRARFEAATRNRRLDVLAAMFWMAFLASMLLSFFVCTL